MDKQADEAWRKDWAGSTQISQTLSYWSAALEEVRLRELWPCYKSRAQDVRICNLSSSHSRPSTGSYKQPTKIRTYIYYMILHFVWQDSLVSFYYATHRVPNSPPTQPTMRPSQDNGAEGCSHCESGSEMKELTSSLQINFMLNLFDPDIQHVNCRW